ncbi:serpin B11 [Perognathus longimembris pacificus]|uniref:serpin B11 n=1 Tax=Perognathus longimembris pacificus TaxID=214514 RepID=UPI002018CCEF|nr:serpin B11 [Perognathus longimembris pacificus]
MNMGSLSTTNVEFCFDVFKELSCNNAGQNVFFSPLSLFYALNMILLGARGKCAQQVEKVLHYHHSAEFLRPRLKDSLECRQAGRMHSELGDLLSQINRPHSNYTLSIANRLYGTKAVEFHQQYLSCSEKLYQARLQSVDFGESVEETRKSINAWVESKTNGKVKNLFGEGTIDPSSVMVLVSAIYYKGQWQNKFQEKETTKTPFQLSAGNSVMVDMMYQTGTFKMASIKKPPMQVLELPYGNSKLSMVILLPVGTADLDQIEKQLTARTFREWTSSPHMVEREVEVHLPRFKLANKYELNSLLKALGMTDIFNEAKADFSGMSPDKGLFLSKVVHKAYVEVNEEGTEAAAATGESVAVKRLPIRDRFVANHPFLFLITDISTGVIFFLGKLASP